MKRPRLVLTLMPSRRAVRQYGSAPVHRSSFIVPRSEAQALVLVALILPFLAALLFTCVEVGARYMELAEIEDALQMASRSAVQAFRYDAFAENRQALATQARVVAVARGIFITNLTGMRGLEETPAQTADRVQWTVLPNGGDCHAPDRPALHFTTPAVCATLRPQMIGLLGWGSWSPQIVAAETLDHIGN